MSRLHSDSLPRVDHGMENWTTEIHLNHVDPTPLHFVSDMINKHRDKRANKRGGKISKHRGAE